MRPPSLSAATVLLVGILTVGGCAQSPGVRPSLDSARANKSAAETRAQAGQQDPPPAWSRLRKGMSMEEAQRLLGTEHETNTQESRTNVFVDVTHTCTAEYEYRRIVWTYSFGYLTFSDRKLFDWQPAQKGE